MKLSALWIYPIKSLGGIACPEAELVPGGLRHDRRWMLLDARGHFLSQRQLPQMARLRVTLGQELQVRAPGAEPLQVPLPPYDGPLHMASIWGRPVTVQSVSDRADQWLTQQLGQACQLVYQPAPDPRPDSDLAVSLADGYPLLLTSDSSLAALAEACGHPLEMRMFRPNLVVSGAPVWAENHWRGLRIAAHRFTLPKPCTRCVMITQDPDSGASRVPGLLKTLITLSQWQGQPVFGQNLAGPLHGWLRVGDTLSPEV